MSGSLEIDGLRYLPGYLDEPAQRSLVDVVRNICRIAPLTRYDTPMGRPMSVRMTAAGRFGWVSDRRGYRYADRHPDGQHWPEIPIEISRIWDRIVPEARTPECCLINYYDTNARMGLHQDKDEADFEQPVLSVSLGDDARFRIGGLTRKDSTRSFWLRSGDVLVLEGAARLRHHGIDRVRPGSSSLLSNGGRINLTLRVVT